MDHIWQVRGACWVPVQANHGKLRRSCGICTNRSHVKAPERTVHAIPINQMTRAPCVLWRVHLLYGMRVVQTHEHTLGERLLLQQWHTRSSSEHENHSIPHLACCKNKPLYTSLSTWMLQAVKLATRSLTQCTVQGIRVDLVYAGLSRHNYSECRTLIEHR